MHKLAPYVLGISILLSGFGVSSVFYDLFGTDSRWPEYVGTAWVLLNVWAATAYDEIVIKQYLSRK